MMYLRNYKPNTSLGEINHIIVLIDTNYGSNCRLCDCIISPIINEIPQQELAGTYYNENIFTQVHN